MLGLLPPKKTENRASSHKSQPLDQLWFHHKPSVAGSRFAHKYRARKSIHTCKWLICYLEIQTARLSRRCWSEEDSRHFLNLTSLKKSNVTHTYQKRIYFVVLLPKKKTRTNWRFHNQNGYVASTHPLQTRQDSRWRNQIICKEPGRGGKSNKMPANRLACISVE